MALLLCVVFFLSGASALLFETLWFHQAGLAFGNSIWASSLVLAGFMGGLAVGNGVVGRLGPRIERPVRLYALLEGVIAVSGVALVHLLPGLGALLAPLLRALAEQPWLLQPLRLAAAFALLLVPSTAMGATLPLLVSALYRRDPHFGRVLGRLYGWNTAGAVVGALAAEALVVEWLGIRGAARAAALLNLAAGGLALGLARPLDREAAAAPRAPSAAPLSPRAWGLLAGAFACGAILLALEVVWFRLLLLKVLGSGQAFAILLAVVLSGIALGGLGAAAWLSRAPHAARALPALAFASAALCVATYAAHGSSLAAAAPGSVAEWGGVVALALPLMLPVCLLSGALFTLSGDALHREGLGETRAAGLLALANTVGAMLGSLLGGFVLLPGLGVEGSLHLLAATYLVTGLGLSLLGVGPRRVPGRAAAAAFGGLGLALVVLFPSGLLRERYLAHALERFARLEGARPIAVREGTLETAVVLESRLYGEPLYHRLVTNGYSMSSTTLPSLRYMKLFVWLPVALRPEPESALLISFGVGSTARALVDTASLSRIDVVDISRDVLELSWAVHPDPAHHPLSDPRVRVHVEDGRHFLATRRERFDLITAEPPPPKAAGVGNLYSREYFELLRARLEDGGVASYWLPVHNLLPPDAFAILRAFCDAFPDCALFAGAGLDWIMLGTRDAVGPVPEARFRAQWQDPRVAEELRAAGLDRPEQLGALFLAGAEDLAPLLRDVAPLDDDHPERLSDRVLGPARLASSWLPWLDPALARERFAHSGFAARLWPPALREASLDWFEARAAAERHLLGAPGRGVDFAALHGWLARTPLESLALWELGTNALRLRAARAAAAAGRSGAEVERELALGALAARDFAGAAVGLARARAAGSAAGDDARLEIYALCAAGSRDAARVRAAALGLGQNGDAFAAFLREALDPRCLP